MHGAPMPQSWPIVCRRTLACLGSTSMLVKWLASTLGISSTNTNISNLHTKPQELHKHQLHTMHTISNSQAMLHGGETLQKQCLRTKKYRNCVSCPRAQIQLMNVVIHLPESCLLMLCAPRPINKWTIIIIAMPHHH